MNTNFSLQRIKLLLKADMREQLRQFLLSIGSYMAVFIIFLVFMQIKYRNDETLVQQEIVFYYLGFIVSFILFCQFVNQKIHQFKGLYLTIPASTAEKYITLLIEGVLILSFYYLTFSLSIKIISMFFSSFPVLATNKMPEINNTPVSISIFIFIASTYFLSNITFRKYALPIASGFYVFLITIFNLLFRKAVTDPSGDVYMIETTPLYYIYNFLTQHHSIILYAATLLVLYAGYHKLKEKQIR